MPHEVGRRALEADPPRHRPGDATVGRLGLHDRERRHARYAASFLDTDRRNEPARRKFDHVRLVVVGRGRMWGHRHPTHDPPCPAAVAGPGGGDLADKHVLPAGEWLAEVEQVAAGELDRAVGRGDG